MTSHHTVEIGKQGAERQQLRCLHFLEGLVNHRQLVVRIGDGAMVGSGSVITDDVPADALAFGRAHQVTKPDRAEAFRARQRARKAEGS